MFRYKIIYFSSSFNLAVAIHSISNSDFYLYVVVVFFSLCNIVHISIVNISIIVLYAQRAAIATVCSRTQQAQLSFLIHEIEVFVFVVVVVAMRVRLLFA